MNEKRKSYHVKEIAYAVYSYIRIQDEYQKITTQIRKNFNYGSQPFYFPKLNAPYN